MRNKVITLLLHFSEIMHHLQFLFAYRASLKQHYNLRAGAILCLSRRNICPASQLEAVGYPSEVGGVFLDVIQLGDLGCRVPQQVGDLTWC